jgi:hypothetical protein
MSAAQWATGAAFFAVVLVAGLIGLAVSLWLRGGK